jgi:hypothetical protein
VLLGKHDELGWKIYFQGRDCDEMCKSLLFFDQLKD